MDLQASKSHKPRDNRLQSMDKSALFKGQMPVSYCIDPTSDLWVIVCSGLATGDEYLQRLERSSLNKAFHWNIDLLLDISMVDEFDIDLPVFEKIKTMEEAAIEVYGPQKYKIAAITRHDSDKYNVFLYKAMMNKSDIDYQDFNNLRNAMEWLGRTSSLDLVCTSISEILSSGSDLDIR